MRKFGFLPTKNKYPWYYRLVGFASVVAVYMLGFFIYSSVQYPAVSCGGDPVLRRLRVELREDYNLMTRFEQVWRLYQAGVNVDLVRRNFSLDFSKIETTSQNDSFACTARLDYVYETVNGEDVRDIVTYAVDYTVHPLSEENFFLGAIKTSKLWGKTEHEPAPVLKESIPDFKQSDSDWVETFRKSHTTGILDTITARIAKTWSRQKVGFRDGLVTTVRISLYPNGEIIDAHIEESSSDSYFDSTVIAAAFEAAPFKEIRGLDRKTFTKTFQSFLVTITTD